MNAFLMEHGSELVVKIGEHLYLSAMALCLGVLVALPLGIALTKTKRIANIVIGLASILQTVPSLALLTIMVPFLGVGKLPAIIALFIYSLLPILRNTYIGMCGVDVTLKDAAKGMGMTDMQSIIKVELPLAIPTIMAGIRLSAVYVVAWATLASYIGAGGLGDFIFAGLNLYKPDFIIAGTIPVTVIALLADFGLGKLEREITPMVLRGNKE